MEEKPAQARNQSKYGGAPSLVLSVSDGRAGNVALANGLGRRLAQALGAEHEARVWRQIGAWAPPALQPHGAWTLKMLPVAARPGPPWPIAIVGGGRRVAPLVAAARVAAAQSDARLWAIQTPWPQMSADAFDLVVAPRHDRRGDGRSRVIETLGAPCDAATDGGPKESAANALTGLRRPLIGALIGGSTKRLRFDAARVDALAAQLTVLARQADGSVAAAPSRRTGAENTARLAARLTGALGVQARVWDPASGAANPYQAILAAADAFVVTSDSVNMASEAAATGKPVFIHDIGEPSAKLRRFHADLRAYGAARPIESGWATWVYPPLDESRRAAQEIAARIWAG